MAGAAGEGKHATADQASQPHVIIMTAGNGRGQTTRGEPRDILG